jgi:hypothetical protein
LPISLPLAASLPSSYQWLSLSLWGTLLQQAFLDHTAIAGFFNFRSLVSEKIMSQWKKNTKHDSYLSADVQFEVRMLFGFSCI